MNRKLDKEEDSSLSHVGRKSMRFSSVAKSLIMLKKGQREKTPDELAVSSSRPVSSTLGKTSVVSLKSSGKTSVNDHLLLPAKKKSGAGSISPGRTSNSR